MASAVLVAVAVSWSTVSCSTTTSSTPADRQVRPAASAARTTEVCLGNLPAEWSAALAKSTFQLPSVLFSPWTVDSAHDVVYGNFQSSSQQGVAAVDLHTGRLRVLSVMSAQAAGVGWMSFSDPWLVWEQTESQYTLGNWTIQLLDTRTGKQRQLGVSRLPDGSFLTGQLSFPVVGKGYVAWSQPTSRSSVDLRLYRLETGESLALDSGKLSSPVIAAGRLVWGKFGAHDSQPSLRMADAVTLKSLAVPDLLKQPMPIGYLAGSSDYLLWTSGQTLIAEQLSNGALTRYQFARDALKHPFQFIMVAGHFVVWFTGYGNTILDMRTGQAVDVALPSASAAGGDEIVVTRPGPGPKGAVTSTSLSWLRIGPSTRLGSCSS